MSMLLRCFAILLPFVFAELAGAQDMPAVTVVEQDGEQTYSLSIQILALMTALTVLPALVLSMTAFTRIIIVLAILRQASGRRRRRQTRCSSVYRFFSRCS